jgi:predicted nuclease of restriction endonuclease-like (RecB) superfamily
MPTAKAINAQPYSSLITDLASLIEQGRKAAVRYVNTALVATYWLMGRRIVEYEQKGRERAEYGEALLKRLSKDLTKQFGKGWGEPHLRAIRQFYLIYGEIEKRYTLCSESRMPNEAKIRHTARIELLPAKILSPKSHVPTAESFHEIFPLSWSHYRLLMRLDEPFKREFYEAECLRGNWSVRQLDRQIQSMLYERTALSKRKLAVIAKSHKNPITLRPEDEIKDPYILEFLGLKDEYSESQLEEALIRHIENFLLELGIGFTFVARQKRITIEGTHYRLDLLLYHRILRCLVAVDLKMGEFSHSDAGQMNLYLNYLKDKEKLPGENDPVGIILCSSKKNVVVEYALGGMSNKIFTSTYKLQLPDPEVLRAEIEQERQRLLEMGIINRGKAATHKEK